MRDCITWMFRKAALGVAILCSLGCAENQGLPGFSIEATTGKRTGNPFEIRLTARRAKLKAVLINRAVLEKTLLHDAHVQTSTLELISSTGSVHKPYDSRMIMKYDSTPYCQLFQTLAPGKKLELGSVRFRESRDGFAGQWGPFNFDELPAGDYLARVIWQSEQSECFDENTRNMRKVPATWRGIVRSNQVTLHLL